MEKFSKLSILFLLTLLCANGAIAQWEQITTLKGKRIDALERITGEMNVAMAESHLFFLQDGETAWQEELEGNSITAVAVNGEHVFAGISSTDPTIFRYDLATGEWEIAAPLVTDEDDNTVSQILVTDTHLFARTERDIFVSTDNGEVWSKMEGLVDGFGAKVYPISMTYSEGRLFASTFRTGTQSFIFRSDDLSSFTIPYATESRAESIAAFGDYLYFTGHHGENDRFELFRTDDLFNSIEEVDAPPNLSGYSILNRFKVEKEVGSLYYIGFETSNVGATRGSIYELQEGNWVAFGNEWEDTRAVTFSGPMEDTGRWIGTSEGVFVENLEGGYDASNEGFPPTNTLGTYSSSDRVFVKTLHQGVRYTDNFEQFNLNDPFGFEMTFFPTWYSDGNHLYMGGAGYGMFRSSDNGQNWESLTGIVNERNEEYIVIQAIGKRGGNFYAKGYNGNSVSEHYFFQSGDGVNWESSIIGTDDPAYSSFLIPSNSANTANYGWLSSSNLLRSNDGLTWEKFELPFQEEADIIIGLQTDGENTIYVHRMNTSDRENIELWKSEDEGATWSRVDEPVFLHAIHENTLWATNIAGNQFLISEDEGVTWNDITEALDVDITGNTQQVNYVVYTTLFGYHNHHFTFTENEVIISSFADGIWKRDLDKIIQRTPWSPVTGGTDPHLIAVQADVISDIAGASLQEGDCIGLFFEEGGNLINIDSHCWDGESFTFNAWGNSAVDEEPKNGFVADEVFQFRVYQASTDTEKTAIVTFDEGAAFDGGTYLPNGLSKINSITVAPDCEEQTLTLHPGWNLVSFYVAPTANNMGNIFSEIGEIIVKDAAGDVQLAPEFGIGGEVWQADQAYNMYVTTETEITVCGQLLDAEMSFDIPLETYPYFRPYPQRNEQPAVDALAGLGENFRYAQVIRWDAGTGRFDAYNYIPEHILSPAIDEIGSFQAGDGIKVSMLQAVNGFQFPEASGSSGERQTLGSQNASLRHYNQPIKHTGNNAVWVFAQEALEGKLHVGDELAIINPKGQLLGAGSYQGSHLVITVWQVEGMQENESLELHVWNAASRTVEKVALDSRYTTNELEIIEKLELNTLTGSPFAASPNPAKDRLKLGFQLEKEASVSITFFDQLGQPAKVVRPAFAQAGHRQMEISLTGWKAGLYIAVLEVSGKVTERKRVMVLK